MIYESNALSLRNLKLHIDQKWYIYLGEIPSWLKSSQYVPYNMNEINSSLDFVC